MERMFRRCVGRRTSFVAVVMVMATLLSGCWLQLGFDGGPTRYNPSERRLAEAPRVW
jgi:hypothetical protein